MPKFERSTLLTRTKSTEADNQARVIRELPLAFRTADGAELAGKWFLAGSAHSEQKAVVVVAGGGGIPARAYYGLARYLAARSIAVFTFDYRGIGASRRGSLRGFDGGTELWAVYDFGAALGVASCAYPNLKRGAVAHSVGTLLVGAAPKASQLSRLVFFAPHTGYWRDYALRWRWALYATWHLFMPAMTLIFGYFPGKKLRLGEDLPARFALDWAGRRRPEIARRHESRPIDEILKGYDDIYAPTLAISASDDAIAPPNAAKRLLALYRNLPVQHIVVTPAETGGQRVGHFGFLRRTTGTTYWEAAAAWLLSDQPVALVEPRLKVPLDPS